MSPGANRRTSQIVRNDRGVYRRLVGAGMFFSTCSCALVAHVLLDWAQALGLLRGDYASHAHGSLGPLTLGTVTVAAGAMLSFLLHLADTGSHSLPSYTRAWYRNLNWRTAVAVALAAGAMLIVMETVEQVFAHRFDGILSALGDEPVIAFALIFAISIAIVAALRLLCSWLGRVDGRIFTVLVTILRAKKIIDLALFRRLSPNRTSGFQFACEVPNIFAKRAPPTRLAR